MESKQSNRRPQQGITSYKVPFTKAACSASNFYLVFSGSLLTATKGWSSVFPPPGSHTPGRLPIPFPVGLTLNCSIWWHLKRDRLPKYRAVWPRVSISSHRGSRGQLMINEVKKGLLNFKSRPTCNLVHLLHRLQEKWQFSWCSFKPSHCFSQHKVRLKWEKNLKHHLQSLCS